MPGSFSTCEKSPGSFTCRPAGASLTAPEKYGELTYFCLSINLGQRTQLKKLCHFTFSDSPRWEWIAITRSEVMSVLTPPCRREVQQAGQLCCPLIQSSAAGNQAHQEVLLFTTKTQPTDRWVHCQVTSSPAIWYLIPRRVGSLPCHCS